jgi:glycosyltransferase involved in cell wall biosynthesis/SAM-dependent methyltransferase
MHILFTVHQFFPVHYTGTERLVLNLCKQMQKMGHRVKVLTYAVTESEGFSERCGVLAKEYHYQGIPVIAIRHRNIPALVNYSIFDEQLAEFMDDLLTKDPVDLIHCCHLMRIGEIVRSAKKQDIPVILTLTDFWLMCPRGIAITEKGVLCEGSNDGTNCKRDCYPGDAWKDSIPERFSQTAMVFDYAAGIVSATYFLKMMFENKGYSQNIHIIRFGKDYNYIRKKTQVYHNDSEITIGYLSSLNPHKGAHLLLEAFMQVNPKNIRIKVFGDTSADPEYFTILKKISRGHSGIEFCGRYDYEEMPEIFETVDIIAVPSLWWENSPLVLLRSLAHNVPAIVSNLGGLTEVIKDGQNGFTFTVGYSDSLADNSRHLSEIIAKLSEHVEILNDLKKNIRSPPRIEEEAFAYENLYRKILSGDTAMDSISDLPPEDKDADVQTAAANPQFPADIREKYGRNFVYDIHPNDAMYQFLKNHPQIKEPLNEYFISGESMVHTLNGILADQKINPADVASFLDFAAGYGRFTRFLPSMFPSGSITVSDIDRDAVDFCREKLHVEGFYSSEDPDDVSIQKKFDVIWVASLFSHLSLAPWEAWIKKLYGMLNDGGIVIFSTHGCHCFTLLDETTRQNAVHADHGFYFLKQSEIDKLSPEVYGTAYVSKEFVTRLVEKDQLGQIVGYYPKKLWDFQDIYVVRKQTM